MGAPNLARVDVNGVGSAPPMDEPPRSGASPTALPKSAPQSDSTRDVAAEDFLFHLYRGSELLQDSRVLEAKEELEHALLLQPRDPKGQDLLATVYFRIGLYPRAIQIYEQLLRDNPSDPALKLNVSLCYLKTGQANLARAALEDVVRANPAHRRAWGYLGLAYERLGDHEKAEAALDRGGHAAMARRIADRRGRPSFAVPQPEDLSRESIAVRATAAKAFDDLETGHADFSLAESSKRTGDGEPWRAVELGQAQRGRAVTVPAAASPRVTTKPPVIPEDPGAADIPPPPRVPSRPLGRSVAPPMVTAGPPTVMLDVSGGAVARPSQAALLGPASRKLVASSQAVTVENGQVVLSLAQHEVAARLETLRAYSGHLDATLLERKGRLASRDDKGGATEPLGGMVAPLHKLTGDGLVVLGARPGRALHPWAAQGDELLFVREDFLLAFDLVLSHETGRLARGDDEPLWLVQLRGLGVLVLDLPEPPRALDVTASRSVTLRFGALVGWSGRLVPRALSPGEAPAAQHGLVTLSGEGTVLVSGR